MGRFLLYKNLPGKKTAYYIGLKKKLVCRVKKDDGVGQAYFEIVDAITSPPMGDEIGEWTCVQNDEEVDYVNALGYFDEETPVVTIGEYTGWLYLQRSYLLSELILKRKN